MRTQDPSKIGSVQFEFAALGTPLRGQTSVQVADRVRRADGRDQHAVDTAPRKRELRGGEIAHDEDDRDVGRAGG